MTLTITTSAGYELPKTRKRIRVFWDPMDERWGTQCDELMATMGQGFQYCQRLKGHANGHQHSHPLPSWMQVQEGN